MSNTRHAASGSTLSQQGFCSSVEYERGLLANAVAMRCELLDDAADKELVFALQYLSWQPGGLKKVAADLHTLFAGRFCTPSMQRFGTRPGQVYTASQVKAVRSEIPGGEERFTLAGEISDREAVNLPQIPCRRDDPMGDRTAEVLALHRESQQRAEAQPSDYSSQTFVSHCQAQAGQLASHLAQLCIDPATSLQSASPWWFPGLVSSIRDYLKSLSDRAAQGLARTQIAVAVWDGLDYCRQTGEMTPIYGLARTGKTAAAKAWCEQRPGQARYIQVPHTADDASFIRRIAEAYGVSSGLSLKNTQIRERVERTARSAGILLCFDEAHNLLNQDYRARKRPSRISWIMNELVNYGVPVVLLTTPQFEQDKLLIKERTGWNWDQFDGRIGMPVMLPHDIPRSDLEAVARAQLPGADRDCLKALVGYAMFSKSQLAGIDHIVKRARFEAQKAGREVTLADVKSAIERRLPVDPEASGVRIEEAPPKSKRPQLVRSPLLAPAPVEAGREESRISFEEFPSNA